MVAVAGQMEERIKANSNPFIATARVKGMWIDVQRRCPSTKAKLIRRRKGASRYHPFKQITITSQNGLTTIRNAHKDTCIPTRLQLPCRLALTRGNRVAQATTFTLCHPVLKRICIKPVLMSRWVIRHTLWKKASSWQAVEKEVSEARGKTPSCRRIILERRMGWVIR